ncbi:ATP-binding protein [Robbsia andropogonis]|uniref:ATP-binding protein n=1 Tax=Robbsia andropogonis TaxID=28092 RepID=UPI0004B872BC|nr:ATP-binding protein [Robbsia andropogonis]
MSSRPALPRINSRLRRGIKRLNTVFVRYALLAIVLLMLTQWIWIFVVGRQHARIEATHIARVSAVVYGAATSNSGPKLSEAQQDAMAATLRFNFVDAGPNGYPPGCPDGCADTTDDVFGQLRGQLPPDSRVVLDKHTSQIWLRYGDAKRWLRVPVDSPAVERLIGASAMMLALAVAFALLGAWQIQRPLRRLARAARDLRIGIRPAPVVAAGPSEVKSLITDFNQMTRDICDADQERAIMLAGVAHDLRAPLARMQVRAALIGDDRMQHGFLNDTAAMSRIVSQFLAFAGSESNRAQGDGTLTTTMGGPGIELTSVDVLCEQRYGREDASGVVVAESHAPAADDARDASDPAHEPPLILVDLQAGASFKLPTVDIDRILSNLIENGFAYGAPPLVIETRRAAGCFTLAVRDHGPGIPQTDIERVQRPFVRLDAARGDSAHSGLGLAIVRRLARSYDADMTLTNVRKNQGGGLRVSLSFPMR